MRKMTDSEAGGGFPSEERQPLWPAGIAASRSPDVPEPCLIWCAPPPGGTRNGSCAVLLAGEDPGGVSCGDLARAWCDRLTPLGVQCAVLVHRAPRLEGPDRFAAAWEDGRRGIRLVRSQAAARGFDPERIFTVSASAGSHVATLLATSALAAADGEPADELDRSVPCHVNAAVAFCLAYALSDGFDAPNAREGDGTDIDLDPAFAFDDKTAPMCLLHGGADPHSPLASTRVYRRLREKGVPAELHLFSEAGHGAFGLERAIEFLRQLAFFGPLEPEVPILGRFASDAARAVHETRRIWEGVEMPDPQADQCDPILEWHLPAKRTTDAIQIVWSGGAYSFNDPDGFEVAPVRRYLNDLGMAVATVRYRTPRPAPPLAKHVTAWQDVQRAIRLVRAGAAERGLDPGRIGVLGSSAGAHLALMAATCSRHRAYRPLDKWDETVPCNVQWAVCIYPAYCLTDGTDKTNTVRANAPDARLAPEFSFDPDTPPMLFVHGDADVWAAVNSVVVWEQLRRMGLQGQLHTLARRGHCFYRDASPGTGSYTFLERISEFLRAKGVLKA